MRLARFASALFLAAAASLAAAQPYPARGIRLIVDTSSGNVAADFLLRSPADGYTLMIAAAGNLAVKPGLTFALLRVLLFRH